MRWNSVCFGLVVVLGTGCEDSEIPIPQTTTKKAVNWVSSHDGDEQVEPQSVAKDFGGRVTFGTIAMKASDKWMRRKPQSSFTLAEFELPAPAGADTNGRLTLSVVGGSVADNVARWEGQFGGTAKTKTEKFEVGGMQITMIEMTGEFNDQRGPYAPAVKRPDYRMIAAIIPVNGELHFVKAVGPRATIDENANEIRMFVRTVEIIQ